ncbi:hypothetical protein E3N88_40516 [Mikania micrantha]|uniref:Uncharacterized protein n=1 Tax=Mikania micrantha TaxID=192012 RepID=A0A5N6LMY2_9ASTR|nr:hypothetical protein E3N88_40516 [Mikania micrantha]
MPNVKQKDIVSSFVPQHEESSVNVRYHRVLGTKGLVRIKGLNLNVNKQSAEWVRELEVVIVVDNRDMIDVHVRHLEEHTKMISIKMASSSSSYKYQKDEKAIQILEKSFSEEKKDDKIMRNSIRMLNGLLIADIRSNIANLSDLLDDTSEGAEAAKDYMVSQLMMNEEMHAGIEDLLKVTIDKMQKKRDGVDEIKKF